jgi:carboxyl-terminal processing protease
MVNEGSASASEIFAAAIQDYKRGIIVGSTSTYGKGTVQKNVPVGRSLDMFSGKTEFGALKLTFQKFYRINGGSTQLKGVTPDIVLPDYYDFMKIREKDNPDALPWDEIAKSSYQYWQKGSDNFDSIVKKENNEIKTDWNFKLIKDNTQWLSKNMDSPVDLNIEKYKKQQKLLQSTNTQIGKLSKLENEMDVEVTTLDKPKFYNNPDKGKGERYQRWLKDLKTDLYISQSVKIVGEMITSNTSNTVSK